MTCSCLYISHCVLSDEIIVPWYETGKGFYSATCNVFHFVLRVNFWGYSTVNYFSPMIRYSSIGTCNCGRDAVNELKLFIREAHKRGIEVRASSIIADFSFPSYFISQSSMLIHACRWSWMLYLITQLKAMKMAPFYRLEVLIIVHTT